MAFEPTMIETVLIISCLVLIFVLAIMAYLGVFHQIEIRVGPPPVGDFMAFYKYCEGPYEECRTTFSELSTLVPTVHRFGIFYDDPKLVEESKLRCAIGAAFLNEIVLTSQNERFHNLLQINGFKKYWFPKPDRAVTVAYPISCKLSIYIAVERVTKRLEQFVEENRLDTKSIVEYYKGNHMYFYIPLDGMEDFLVPEAL